MSKETEMGKKKQIGENNFNMFFLFHFYGFIVKHMDSSSGSSLQETCPHKHTNPHQFVQEAFTGHLLYTRH